jgi:hypothetical protein
MMDKVQKHNSFNQLQVSESKSLGKPLDLGKTHNKELRDMSSLVYLVRVVTSGRLHWAGPTVRLQKRRNTD